MSKATEFKTPMLRLVQGDCFEANTKDQQGRPLMTQSGNPTQNYFIAAAGRKGDPGVEAFKAQIDQLCRAEWPMHFANGVCTNRNFSSKVVDGDGTDDNGKPNNLKEGFAGHWIFKFKSTFAPKCYAAGKYAPTDQLGTVGPGGAKLPNPIPRGYHIRVAGTMQTNANQQKPGIYLNFSLVELTMVGDVITSGPDAASVFGNAAPQPQYNAAPAPMAPAGLVMLPAANGVAYDAYRAQGWTDDQLIASGFAMRPAAAPAAPMAPAPAPAAPMAPAAPAAPLAVAPHPGILTGPQMLPAAGALSYAQYQAQGWTDAQLISAGFMAAPAAAAAPAPLPPGGSAPMPPAPAPTAPAPVGKRMLPAANGVSYEAYIAQGWTDALLIQNGFMAV